MEIMSSFKNADAGVIVDQLIKTIQERKRLLSERLMWWVDWRRRSWDQHEQRFLRCAIKKLEELHITVRSDH